MGHGVLILRNLVAVMLLGLAVAQPAHSLLFVDDFSPITSTLTGPSSGAGWQARQGGTLTAQEAHTQFREQGSAAVVFRYAAAQQPGGAADALHVYLMALANVLEGEPAGRVEQARAIPEASFYQALIAAIVARNEARSADSQRWAEQAVKLDSRHPFALNLLAQVRLQQKRYKEADQLLTRALARAPDFAGALSNLGALRFFEGDFSGAVRLYDRALQRAPDMCESILGRSAAYLNMGNLDSGAAGLETCVDVPELRDKVSQLQVAYALAQGDLESAQKYAAQWSDAASAVRSYWLADIALRAGDLAAARKHLQATARETAATRYMESYLYAAQGDFARATQQLTALAEEVGDINELNQARAVFRHAGGSTPKPWPSLNAAATANEVKQNAYLRAVVADAKVSPEARLQLWQASTAVVPGFDLAGASSEALSQTIGAAESRALALSMLFYLRGYHTLAQAALSDVVAESSVSPATLLLHTIVNSRLGDQQAVSASVSRLLQNEPRLFSALYQSAEIAIRESRPDDAISLLSRAVAEKPDKGALLKLALLEDAADNLSGAEHALNLYMQNYPNDFVGYSQLSWFYAKRGDNLTGAMKLAQQADALQPGNVSILDTIGWIHLLQGNLNKARKALESANTAAAGRHPDVLYHLAELERRAGNTLQAQSLLHQALSLDYPFESRAAAQQLQRELADEA